MPPKNNVKVPAIKVANGNYAENWREMELAKAGKYVKYDIYSHK